MRGSVIRRARWTVTGKQFAGSRLYAVILLSGLLREALQHGEGSFDRFKTHKLIASEQRLQWRGALDESNMGRWQELGTRGE